MKTGGEKWRLEKERMRKEMRPTRPVKGVKGERLDASEDRTQKEEMKRDVKSLDMVCLDTAIRKIEELKQMEGVMEFEGGRVSFLVYRVD